MSTLAEREVCLPRAADASSCTVVERAIRDAMDVNSTAKSSSVLSDRNLAFSLSTQASTHAGLLLPVDSVHSASARSRTASANFLLRSVLTNPSVDLAADSRMAMARTTATSSSSLSCDSSAPDTSSIATWNEIDTDRSEPMEERAVAAVPPIPLSSDMLPASRFFVASNYRRLLRGFGHCAGRTLSVRELPATGGIKRTRGGGETCKVRGVVFGVTVGALLDFVAHEGIRQWHQHRRLRAKLTSIAGLQARTGGTDGGLLAAGMAAARLPSKDIRLLPEFAGKRSTTSRQGSLCALVGASAALLAAVEIVAEIELPKNDVLSVAASEAAAALADMRCAIEGRGEREAEMRAMQRLANAARKSWRLAEQMQLAPEERLLLQLRNAAEAAFPAAEANESRQAELISGFRAAARVVPDVAPSMLPVRNGFLPLSELGRLDAGELGGTSSASSSSLSSSLSSTGSGHQLSDGSGTT